MSQLTSHQTPVVPARADGFGTHEDLAVKSALKATLDCELAREASAPRAAASPQHLASPGRFRSAAT
jgi:hypothetical protein